MASAAPPNAVDVARRLRCLVCDDNLVLLKLHATLLKRRFSHVLDGPPIAVDGGLKAIQALRQEVFDVLLLDIQMPFCSGIDVSRRIRAGSDGILEANRSIIILATTTAVGPIPNAVYRSIGMNGVLPKPVRAAHLASFLGALIEAPIPRLVERGDGTMVRAAQEPNFVGSFFLPDEDAASKAIARPEICNVHDFEAAIHEQTKASLKLASQISRSTSVPSTSGFDARSTALRRESDSSEISSSSSENLPLRARGDAFSDCARGNSVAISSGELKSQLAHEVAQMHAADAQEKAQAESKAKAEAEGVASASAHAYETALQLPLHALIATRFNADVADVVIASSSQIPKSLTPPPTPSLPICTPLMERCVSAPAWLADWDLASGPLDFSADFDAFVAAAERNKTAPEAEASSGSTPTSPVLAAASLSSKRRSMRTLFSEDGSDFGSGVGSVSASSRSTTQSSTFSFSPRTPSEASTPSPSYFPHGAVTHHVNNAYDEEASKRHRRAACFLDTSATARVASSPTLAEAASLPGRSTTRGLFGEQDSLCDPLAPSIS